MASFDPLTLAGFVGAGILILAYFLSQQGWLPAEDWRFPLANLIGSVMIMGSLLVDWNLPSMAIEVFWSAISLYGLARRAQAWRAVDRSRH